MMMSSKDHGRVELVSESFIRPKHEPKAANQPYHLGPIDLFMLPVHPMQKGLLFGSKPRLVPSYLAVLKDSISISLVQFYPLVGRLATQKFLDEHGSWVYVDCSKGTGARFLHASADLSLSDVLSSTDVHPIVRSFFDLGEKMMNHDGHVRPLLSIQVTELLDGLFIGFTMSHSIADGNSLWHFISSLSEIFHHLYNDNNNTPCESNLYFHLDNGKNIEASIISPSKTPIYGPILPSKHDLILKLPYLEPEEFIFRFDLGQLRERIFHFSSTTMVKLKTKAQSEAYKISSFQALSAFFWRCVTKARNLESNKETTCTIVMDIRPRIDPSFTQAHFGNLVIPTSTSCKVGDLLDHDFGWAAELINRAIMGYDDKRIREFITSNLKAPNVAQTSPEIISSMSSNVWIGGSTRFDMYGPQFGLGRAVAVLAGYANKHDGKVIANPGRDGGGSVDLEVCLEPNIMNALELDDEFMSFVSSITEEGEITSM